MQCRSALQRSRCHSRHAFSPALALWSTFSTSTGKAQVTGKAESQDPKSAQRHLDSSSKPAQLQNEQKDRSRRGILPKSLSATWGLHKSIDGYNHLDGRVPEQANMSGNHSMSGLHEVPSHEESEDYWRMAADEEYGLETHTEHEVAEQRGVDNPEADEEASRIEYVEEEEGPSESPGVSINFKGKSKPLTSEDILAHVPVLTPMDQQAPDWKADMAVIRDRARMTKNAVLPEDPAELQTARGLLDYKAAVIQPEKLLVAQPVPAPWTKHRFHKLVYNYPAKSLAREIGVFETYCEMTELEQRARQAVIKQLVAYFRSGFKSEGYRLDVYGSEKTGLAFATSDIDFRLSRTQAGSKKEWHPDYLNSAMDHAFRLLEKSSEHTNVVLRRTGRFPMVSAQHIKSGIDIQITASFPTKPQQAMIKRYLEKIPNLRALYYLIRTTLSVRGFIDVYNGGLGSYGTMMLLIAALTRRGTNPIPDYVPSGSTERHSAYQLLRILNTLSPENFDPVTDGLTLAPIAKKFRKHDWSGHDKAVLANSEPSRQAAQNASFVQLALERQDSARAGQWYLGATKPLQPYLLCLQDPADPRNNDLGIRTHAIKHILATLNDLRIGLRKDLAALEENMTANEKEGGNRMKLISQWVDQERSMIGPFVGRCHELFAERRAKIEAFGSTIEEPPEGLNIQGVVAPVASEAVKKHEYARYAKMSKEVDSEGGRLEKRARRRSLASRDNDFDTRARAEGVRLRRLISLERGDTDAGVIEGQKAEAGNGNPSDRTSPANVKRFGNRAYDADSPRPQNTVDPSSEPSAQPASNPSFEYRHVPVAPKAGKKQASPAAFEAYPTFDPEVEDDSSKAIPSRQAYSSIEVPQWVRENSTMESAPTSRLSTTAVDGGREQTTTPRPSGESPRLRIHKHDVAGDGRIRKFNAHKLGAARGDEGSRGPMRVMPSFWQGARNDRSNSLDVDRVFTVKSHDHHRKGATKSLQSGLQRDR